MAKLLEDDINQWKVEVETIESEEETLQKEQELMRAQDEYQEYMKGVEYELQERCTYDNQIYTKAKVQEMIVDFINTQEVEWSYTLGMFELVKLWKMKDLNKIAYGAYDSTLRILNQCRFKGCEAWRKILTVNEYLSNCHLEYARDTSYTIYLGQLHNALIDHLKVFNAQEPDMVCEQENA